MVGKGVDGNIKSSRIFHQCYVKCCKLQNLTPLTSVIPSGNGKVLDFCVDRIKYAEWPPILNAISCDLSLHSVTIKCRQQVKTILEHIDCERLAKTVNKRAVILTKFMLSNLVEALSQLLSSSTLLISLSLEGLPLRIPYLNPLCEAILTSNCLQHLYLSRCIVGDAGCLALCKAIRSLPNILTLDLSGCELTLLGASYIADLIKHQKIHRYSENWVHTLRYRLPELDTMAGLRRITLCGNMQLGDAGVGKLLEVLADDLWIKALDVQACGLSEATANTAFQMLESNTTMVILDLRNNVEVSNESLSKLRAALRENERSGLGQYSWLSSVTSISCGDRSVARAPVNKNTRERVASMTRTQTNKYPTKAGLTKKEKDYTESLEEQLQEEISHRQQLEELNLQLVDQMRQLKQQQLILWANNNHSSGSEQSLQASSASGDLSSNTDSSRSVPIDQNTLSYIQQAFRDIYSYIKNNQCTGECQYRKQMQEEAVKEPLVEEPISEDTEDSGSGEDFRINILPKKAQSTHEKLVETRKVKKMTKSAHILENSNGRVNGDNVMTPGMIEKQMGDTKELYGENRSILEEMMAQMKKSNASSCALGSGGSAVSGSSDTLVCSERRPNPRDALYSSDEDE